MSERVAPLGAMRSAFARCHPFPATTDVDERFAEFDRRIAEVQRQAAEVAFAQGVARALAVTGQATIPGDGLLTLIGNPYREEGVR